MAKRKKKIWVRHEVLNRGEICLQRRVINPWCFVFPIMFLSKWGYVWKRWKLLNAELYTKEEEIIKLLDKVKKLVEECNELDQDLKTEFKDVESSVRQTKGFSSPFQLDVPVDDLPFKKQKWLERPDGGWRGYLNPRAFKGLKGTGKQSTREKVGANDEPRAVRTAYIPEDFGKYKMALEEGNVDFDNVMEYKDPDKRNQQRKKNRNNQNRNRNNNRNRNDDDDDFDDYDD